MAIFGGSKTETCVRTLLVFDEPTDGLDPIAVAKLRSILKCLHAEYNLTIVLASHLLSEVEKLVDPLMKPNKIRDS